MQAHCNFDKKQFSAGLYLSLGDIKSQEYCKDYISFKESWETSATLTSS